MNTLQSLLDEYLTLRRALGHKLLTQGQELQQFVAFTVETGADHITLDLAMDGGGAVSVSFGNSPSIVAVETHER